MGEYIHTTGDGKKIPLNELTDEHLANILRRHHELAKDGITIAYGVHDWPGGVDNYYEEEELAGEELLARARHKLYVKEARRRGIRVCICTFDLGNLAEEIANLILGELKVR